MLSNLLGKKKAEEGFTIIEVMIVLAIAGLILVVVLIAIPQLQRNQRNENRRSVASRIVTEINSFAGNNGGDYPAASTSNQPENFGSADDYNSFFGRYLGCEDNGSGTECSTNIDDPLNSAPVGTGTDPDGVAVENDVDTDADDFGDLDADAPAGSIRYVLEAKCNGERTEGTGAERNFAFQIKLEGGAIFCLDNQ